MIRAGRVLVFLSLICAAPDFAAAQVRSAVIVFGATGGDTYAATYEKWEDALVGSLRDRLGFAPERVTVLSERASDTSLRSTAANVRRVLGDLARASGPDDVLLVMLIGHGTIDIGAAKFNLVGPDLDAGQWAALLTRLPGRLEDGRSTVDVRDGRVDDATFSNVRTRHDQRHPCAFLVEGRFAPESACADVVAVVTGIENSRVIHEPRLVQST